MSLVQLLRLYIIIVMQLLHVLSPKEVPAYL